MSENPPEKRKIILQRLRELYEVVNALGDSDLKKLVEPYRDLPNLYLQALISTNVLQPIFPHSEGPTKSMISPDDIYDMLEEEYRALVQKIAQNICYHDRLHCFVIGVPTSVELHVNPGSITVKIFSQYSYYETTLQHLSPKILLERIYEDYPQILRHTLLKLKAEQKL